MTNEQLVMLINDGVDVAENMLQLWKQNEGFIYKIATKYKTYAELEDLKQEGYFGLCEAVEHYDAVLGVLFINYAAFWIKQAMCRYIAKCGSGIRIPEKAINEIQRYKKIRSDYVKRYGIEPTDREMQHLLDVSKKKYENIKKNALIPHIRSLNEPVGGDDEIVLEDSLASDQELEEDIIKKIDKEIMEKEIWKVIDELPDNMATVIKYRYKDNLTLRESGERIGVTLERVRVIKNNAIRKIRSSASRNKNLKLYYDQYLSVSIRHVGIKEFKRTWYSEVESAVLNNMS